MMQTVVQCYCYVETLGKLPLHREFGGRAWNGAGRFFYAVKTATFLRLFGNTWIESNGEKHMDGRGGVALK